MVTLPYVKFKDHSIVEDMNRSSFLNGDDKDRDRSWNYFSG